MDLRPTAPDSQLSPPQLPPAPPRPRGPPRFAVPGSSRPCLGPRGTDPNIAPNLSKEELPRPLPARLGVGGTVRVGGEPLHTPPGEATKDVEPLPRSFQDGDGKEGGSRGRMGGKERVQEAAGRGRRPGVGGWRAGRLLPSGLSSAPPPLRSFPPSLPLQVRSSLGTNTLSAMAAFAGTAILLMDFGVTNWVGCLTPPGVGKFGE